MKQKTLKISANTKKYFLYFFMVAFLVLSLNIDSVKAEQIETDDKKNDLYDISLLNFMLVVGEEYEDEAPDSEKELRTMVNNLVAKSSDVSNPDEVDIECIGVSTDDPDYNVIYVQFFGDPRDLDHLVIVGFGEDQNDDRISFSINLEDGVGNCTYTTDIVEDSNETIAFSTSELVAFALPTEYFDYEEGDLLMVLAMTITVNDVNPLSSNIVYDFCPNDEFSEDKTTYDGDDPVVKFLDSIANFLFGWLFTGRLPFIIFMVCLIVFAQLLLDRKNKYAHWIGLIGIALLLYPIIMYSISIPYSHAVFGVDLIAVLDIITLITLGAFILLTLLNTFKLLKRYKYMFIIALALISFQGSLALIFYSASMSIIIQAIIFGAMNITLPILLRESKKQGRNDKT